MRKDLLDNFNKLLKKTQSESYRGMVLSMAAFTEDLLGNVIKDFLLDVAATAELVEGFNAPLGTFSARIKAAYALGLISEEQHKDINLIRKIRNEFAHSWDIESLDDKNVSQFVDALSIPAINPGISKLTNHLKFQYRAAEILIGVEFCREHVKSNRLAASKSVFDDF